MLCHCFASPCHTFSSLLFDSLTDCPSFCDLSCLRQTAWTFADFILLSCDLCLSQQLLSVPHTNAAFDISVHHSLYHNKLCPRHKSQMGTLVLMSLGGKSHILRSIWLMMRQNIFFPFPLHFCGFASNPVKTHASIWWKDASQRFFILGMYRKHYKHRPSKYAWYVIRRKSVKVKQKKEKKRISMSLATLCLKWKVDLAFPSVCCADQTQSQLIPSWDDFAYVTSVATFGKGLQRLAFPIRLLWVSPVGCAT